MELKARCKERFEPVVQAIRQLQKEKEGLDEPLIVAIDGRCGSGKTTLGEYLEQVFDCNLFRMDDFFLRMEQRTPQRLKETGGNGYEAGVWYAASGGESAIGVWNRCIFKGSV